MTALSRVVQDTETGQPVVGIIADDASARYVWPDDAHRLWADDARRLNMLTEYMVTQPSTAEEWLNVAAANIGGTRSVGQEEHASLDAAEKALTRLFAETVAEQPDLLPPVSASEVKLARAADSFDEVASDYQGFAETSTIDPDAMNNFVMMALGPIDPEGPNGWILRAIDGNPRPGDENEYIHFDAPALERSE